MGRLTLASVMLMLAVPCCSAVGTRSGDSASDLQAPPGPDTRAPDSPSRADELDSGDVAARVLAGDTCESPTRLDFGGNDSIQLHDQTTMGYQNSYSGRQTCFRGAGRDHVYEVTVPARRQLDIALQSAAGYNQLVEIIVGEPSRCALIDADLAEPASPCAVGADFGPAGGVDTASYFNTSDAPQRAFVIVDAAADNGPGGVGGNYGLTLRLSDPPPGEVCQNAVHIEPGILTGESTGGYGNNYGNDTTAKRWPTMCRSSAGPERVYSIDVPPKVELQVKVTALGQFGTAVNVVVGDAARCDVAPRVCDASGDSGIPSVPDLVSYRNTGSLTVTAFIMVESYVDPSYFEARSGKFDIETSLVPISP